MIIVTVYPRSSISQLPNYLQTELGKKVQKKRIFELSVAVAYMSQMVTSFYCNLDLAYFNWVNQTNLKMLSAETYFVFFLLTFLLLAGIRRFSEDIREMLGRDVGLYWKFCWMFMAPIFILVWHKEPNNYSNRLMYLIYLLLL